MSYYDRITRAGLAYIMVFIATITSYLLLMGIVNDQVQLQEVYTLVFGFLTLLFALYIFWSLFRPFKVRNGKGKTYHISPGLAISSIKNTGKYVMPVQHEEGSCYQCGKMVYKPFICSDCHREFCGQHVLQGDHECAGKSNRQ